MALDKSEVEKIAHLARLHVSESEMDEVAITADTTASSVLLRPMGHPQIYYLRTQIYS